MVSRVFARSTEFAAVVELAMLLHSGGGMELTVLTAAIVLSGILALVGTRAILWVVLQVVMRTAPTPSA